MKKNQNSRRKILFSIIICSQIFTAGCSTIDSSQTSEPTATLSANETYKNLYTTVTLAASANGDYENFRWKHGKEPFPYKQSSWVDSSPIPCDENQRYIQIFATVDNPSDTTNFKKKAEKVKKSWESKGLEVRNVSATDVSLSIATDLQDGSTVVYSVADSIEMIKASTQCLSGLEDDQQSTAEVFPAELAE